MITMPIFYIAGPFLILMGNDQAFHNPEVLRNIPSHPGINTHPGISGEIIPGCSHPGIEDRRNPGDDPLIKKFTQRKKSVFHLKFTS